MEYVKFAIDIFKKLFSNLKTAASEAKQIYPKVKEWLLHPEFGCIRHRNVALAACLGVGCLAVISTGAALMNFRNYVIANQQFLRMNSQWNTVSAIAHMRSRDLAKHQNKPDEAEIFNENALSFAARATELGKEVNNYLLPDNWAVFSLKHHLAIAFCVQADILSGSKIDDDIQKANKAVTLAIEFFETLLKDGESLIPSPTDEAVDAKRSILKDARYYTAIAKAVRAKLRPSNENLAEAEVAIKAIPNVDRHLYPVDENETLAWVLKKTSDQSN